MAKETTHAGMLGDLRRIATSLEANAGELSHLEGPRLRMTELLSRAQEIAKQQAALTASRQEATRQLRALLIDGQRMANALRAMIKEHYGIRSEKLAEFGMQPFRGRSRKVKPDIPELPGAPRPPLPSRASDDNPPV